MIRLSTPYATKTFAISRKKGSCNQYSESVTNLCSVLVCFGPITIAECSLAIIIGAPDPNTVLKSKKYVRGLSRKLGVLPANHEVICRTIFCILCWLCSSGIVACTLVPNVYIILSTVRILWWFLPGNMSLSQLSITIPFDFLCDRIREISLSLTCCSVALLIFTQKGVLSQPCVSEPCNSLLTWCLSLVPLFVTLFVTLLQPSTLSTLYNALHLCAVHVQLRVFLFSYFYL